MFSKYIMMNAVFTGGDPYRGSLVTCIKIFLEMICYGPSLTFNHDVLVTLNVWNDLYIIIQYKIYSKVFSITSESTILHLILNQDSVGNIDTFI